MPKSPSARISPERSEPLASSRRGREGRSPRSRPFDAPLRAMLLVLLLAATDAHAQDPAVREVAPAATPNATATAATPVAPQDVPTGALELLDATLWTQHAAERAALCRQTFRLATLRLEQALRDPSWSAAEEQRPGPEALPAAVIVDVDETVLDNVPYQARLILAGTGFSLATWNAWCRELSATPVPGALAFCRRARQLGATVFYVTNRGSDVREETRACLAGWGFPLRDDVECVLTRVDTSDKSPRRAEIARTHRVVLLLGDAGGDFSSALGNGGFAERASAFEARDAHWGRDWFVLPNPMYGPWESSFAPSADVSRLAARLDALDPCGSLPDGTRTHDANDAPCVATPPAFALPRVSAADARASTPGASLPTHPLLDAGPMPTWSTTTGCGLWLRTKAPAAAQVRYWPAGEASEARLSDVLTTRVEDDLVAAFSLEALRPGTTYAYELYLDGRPAPRPWPLVLRTQPLWMFTGTTADKPHLPPDLRIAVGSCAYVNDPPLDRPGKPYGAGYGIFERIAETSPDMMLWLGDNTYLRAGDWESEAGIRHRYAHTRALPELQHLLGATSHLAIWDDHDFGPNDSDRSNPLARAARRTFLDYWPDVTYPEGQDGIYRRIERGDVEVFLLDDRTWRSPNDAPPTDDKRMLGERQLAWLLDALQSSHATFKIVANGGQMLNPIVNYEGFGDFPSEQRALLEGIAARRLDGILFLSGDRHHSELLKLAQDGGPPLYEFTCSPLTAGPVDRDLDPGNTARVPETLVMQRNFGLIEVAGPWGERVLTLSVRDTDGELLWTHSISESELRWE